MLHHGMRAAAGNAGGATPGQMVWAGGTVLNTSGAVDTYSWVVPDGVTSIHAVLVGPGQSGRVSTTGISGNGGDLRYTIDPIAVSPGETLTIEAGKAVSSNSATQYVSGPTAIKRGSTTLIAAGTYGTGSTAISASIGGGTGGYRGSSSTTWVGGAGGAAGYTGNGGSGQNNYPIGTFNNLPTGGGAYGGGYSTGAAYCGGGVGLLGEGASGSSQIGPAQAGSGGGWGYNTNSFGGGGGGNDSNTASYATNYSGMGGVRIIWGDGRSYPDPVDAADYLPETGVSYSEIDIAVAPGREESSIARRSIYEIEVYDENGVDFMPSLTAVAGSPASTLASLSAGQFTVKSYYSLTSTDVGYMNDGSLSTRTFVYQLSPGSNADGVFNILIKPPSAKRISKVVIKLYYQGTTYNIAKIHYMTVEGDGVNITNGRAIPITTYQNTTSPYYVEQTLTFT